MHRTPIIPFRSHGPRAAHALTVSTLGAALAIAILAAAPLAAANPDFAGIWQLDNERSDSLIPVRPGQDPPPPADVELEISLEGEDVVLNYVMRRDDFPAPVQITQRLITDGKPMEMPDFTGRTRTVRVKWRKDKLSQSYTIVGPFGDFDTTETWQLSKDGSELKVRIQTRIPERRPIIRDLIFVPAADVQ